MPLRSRACAEAELLRPTRKARDGIADCHCSAVRMSGPRLCADVGCAGGDPVQSMASHAAWELLGVGTPLAA